MATTCGAVLAEVLDPNFRIERRKLSAAKWRHLVVTDARTGYDATSSEVLPSDRKIAVDAGVLRQGLLEPSARTTSDGFRAPRCLETA